ncbi:MAG: alpha/beta fold hydrolase [Syntrophomonas sp.]
MNIQRLSLPATSDHALALVEIKPLQPRGGIVVVHGYGGSKEEVMGFAWRIAEAGFAVCLVELSGHGENGMPLKNDWLLDINRAIAYCRGYGKVCAIGHSLGGRLALLSAADCAIGISPALATNMSKSTRILLRNYRSYRVNEESFEDFIQLFDALPAWEPSTYRPELIIYGNRDLPQVISDCHDAEAQGATVEIVQAMHNDIYLHEEILKIVSDHLTQWLCRLTEY